MLAEDEWMMLELERDSKGCWDNDCDGGDREELGMTRFRTSIVSSEVLDIDVFVSSPDSIHWYADEDV